MEEKKKTDLRFSIRTLLICVTLVATGLGGWIAYSRSQISRLEELRNEGVIVIIRDRTPQALQSFGISHLSPFFDVPTIELYITPEGESAKVGNGEQPIGRAEAEHQILAQATLARSCGAEDIQLILIDGFDRDWMQFAEANSMLTIGESKDRYAKRLQANQESGANINP